MPPLTRAFLRAGLAWLVIALGLGVAQAAAPRSFPANLRVTVFHFITVGWLTQMIFGVAHWMFPRDTRERPRGVVALGWVAFGALNSGLLLRALTEPFEFQGGGGAALAVAGALQFAGTLAWVLHIWPRIKER